mmetsp:Transcript_9536/g.20315  ORF Transcript_9536/g.20315 Transcript_9536/m.20315 type:complete len:226 (-) Transcript_9536:790-1467(-)
MPSGRLAQCPSHQRSILEQVDGREGEAYELVCLQGVRVEPGYGEGILTCILQGLLCVRWQLILPVLDHSIHHHHEVDLPAAWYPHELVLIHVQRGIPPVDPAGLLVGLIRVEQAVKRGGVKHPREIIHQRRGDIEIAIAVITAPERQGQPSVGCGPFRDVGAAVRHCVEDEDLLDFAPQHGPQPLVVNVAAIRKGVRVHLIVISHVKELEVGLSKLARVLCSIIG